MRSSVSPTVVTARSCIADKPSGKNKEIKKNVYCRYDRPMRAGLSHL